MAVFPLCRTIMSCRKLLREDFSMELRRKGIFKYLPMLLNDSHPPESGGWISGYETCCGFLQLIHMNLYFISFIHLIFLCTYLHAHTLNSHAANFLFSLLLPLSPSGATSKERTRLCTKTPIWGLWSSPTGILQLFAFIFKLKAQKCLTWTFRSGD